MKESIGKKSPERIQMSDHIREVLATVLNQVHGEDRSVRFWGVYMEDYIRSVLTLRNILGKNEIIAKADKYPINSHSFPTLKQNLIYDAKQLAKYWLTKSNKTEIRELLKYHSQVRVGFPELKGIGEDEVGKELPEHHFYVTGLQGNRKRRLIYKIASRFDDPFIRNSIIRLPKIYVEYFNKLYNSVPLYQPEKKTFHVHNIRTDFEKLLIAMYAEKGAKLIWYQHGSHYGEYQHEYLHHLEHSLADEYRTWGWKIKEKDTPWKAYRLEKFKEEYNKYKNEAKYDCLICYPKMYKKYRNHCVEATEYLMRKLDYNKYSSLLARPRPFHGKHGHEAELDFVSHEKIRISSGLEPIAKEVSESRLIVQMNVPGTNFLECIYANHPVTGLLTNTDPTELIKPYYDFLLEKGVLHSDVQSMVDFLNRVDLDDWWKNVTNEKIFMEFKNTFARSVNGS